MSDAEWSVADAAVKGVKQSRETNVEFGAVAIKQIPDLSQKLVLGPGLE